MAHNDLQFRVLGEDLQILEIALHPDETVKAEVGAMLYMDGNIVMQTTVAGGLLQAIKRRISGETLFLPSFSNPSEEVGTVAFAAPHPGRIVAISLPDYDGELLCQKGAFLAASESVHIEVAFVKKLGAGLFGREGFILQRIIGDEGTAFIHAGGTVVRRELSEGEVLRVDSGCLVAFESTVEYNVEFVRGLRNAFLGGEGLFLVRLSGPGRVFLQSLPFKSLADRILGAAGILGDQ